MALQVTVTRGPGDNPAPEEIVLEHCVSEPFARQVGRVAIDLATPGLKRVSGSIAAPRAYIRPGSIIRHQDLRQGDCRGHLEDFSGVISVAEDGTPSCSIGLTFKRQVAP